MDSPNVTIGPSFRRLPRWPRRSCNARLSFQYMCNPASLTNTAEVPGSRLKRRVTPTPGTTPGVAANTTAVHSRSLPR